MGAYAHHMRGAKLHTSLQWQGVAGLHTLPRGAVERPPSERGAAIADVGVAVAVWMGGAGVSPARDELDFETSFETKSPSRQYGRGARGKKLLFLILKAHRKNEKNPSC